MTVEVAELEHRLQDDLDAVVACAEQKPLRIAPDKFTITLFTPDKACQSNVHPQVLVNGQAIPFDKSPRISGVRPDTNHTFGQYVLAVAKNCRSKLRIMSSLAGTGWGCQKELMLSV